MRNPLIILLRDSVEEEQTGQGWTDKIQIPRCWRRYGQKHYSEDKVEAGRDKPSVLS